MMSVAFFPQNYVIGLPFFDYWAKTAFRNVTGWDMFILLKSKLLEKPAQIWLKIIPRKQSS